MPQQGVPPPFWPPYPLVPLSAALLPHLQVLVAVCHMAVAEAHTAEEQPLAPGPHHRPVLATQIPDAAALAILQQVGEGNMAVGYGRPISLGGTGVNPCH